MLEDLLLLLNILTAVSLEHKSSTRSKELNVRNRNRNLESFTTPTKSKSRAINQIQYKIDRHRIKVQRIRQADS